LLALDQNAKFIHIVRDGAEVAQSIAERAKMTFPIVGQHYYNDWWGLDDAKWLFLRAISERRSFLREESVNAKHDLEKGLCEWLITLNEFKMNRDLLNGENFLEVRYNDLVRETRSTLQQVTAFLGLEIDADWLSYNMARVEQRERRTSYPVTQNPELLKKLDDARAAYELD
jgi:hypothetical protein